MSGTKPERKVGKVVWWNGKLVAPEQATTSVFTHTLHYGLGAFEGVRCYKTADGRLAIFRLKEHTKRLFDSCKILELKIPFSQEDVMQAQLETVRKSGLEQDIYIRPLVYIGDGPLGVFPTFDPPVELAIMTWVWGAYLGKEAKENGARIKVSSFTRGWVNSTMTKAKMTGGYTTGILAKLEVKRSGYDEALLLDTDGYVAEGSGENIFMYRNGVLKTTPLTSILDGITRSSIITIARDLGIPVEEQRFTRDEIYCADEVFFCGTAAEITPIREIDNRQIGEGKPGPITRKISTKLMDTVYGRDPQYKHWLTYL
ncbi:MAG: branched-chain amino acid transaminase [Deltaproteobacteria bacterium]|nr:branched-chain amino acid transaminase [Deltaproteobacteria bacterium]